MELNSKAKSFDLEEISSKATDRFPGHLISQAQL
jgi:hypothetical protein